MDSAELLHRVTRWLDQVETDRDAYLREMHERIQHLDHMPTLNEVQHLERSQNIAALTRIWETESVAAYSSTSFVPSVRLPLACLKSKNRDHQLTFPPGYRLPGQERLSQNRSYPPSRILKSRNPN